MLAEDAERLSGKEEGKSKPALLPPIQSQAGAGAREASFIEKYVENGELPGREVRSARASSQKSALGVKSPADERETVTVEPVTGRPAEQQQPVELVVDARRERSAEKQEHPKSGDSSIRLPRGPIHTHPSQQQHHQLAATLGVPTEGLAGLLRVSSAASRSPRAAQQQQSADAPPTETEQTVQTVQPGASGSAKLPPAAGHLGSEEALAEYIEQNKRRIMSALTRGKVSGEADAAALQLLQEHLKLEAGSIRVELDEPASDASSEFDPNVDYYAGGGGGDEWKFAEEGTKYECSLRLSVYTSLLLIQVATL